MRSCHYAIDLQKPLISDTIPLNKRGIEANNQYYFYSRRDFYV